VVLGGKGVNRRGAGEECKGRERSRWNGGKICFHHGDDWSNVQCDRRLDHLYGYVGCSAEGTVRMGKIRIRMNVNGLDGSTGDDKRNTQEREEELPRTLIFRV
jgi:hypothetical protein